MRPLASADMLLAWEEGQHRPAVDRALTLLGAGWQDRPWQTLATASLGERDTLLFALREATFGPTLRAIAECGQCGSELELSMTVSDICAPAGPERDQPEHEFSQGGFLLRFRLPNTTDLAAVRGSPTATAARRLLLHRCVMSSLPEGDGPAGEDLPDDVATELADRMAELDPQAEVSLGLVCPACDHRWSMILDIADFFWTEVATAAARLLRDVDGLARAYGWSERDILAMSAHRRDAYLSLVGV
jgi:hypothetical protein